MPKPDQSLYLAHFTKDAKCYSSEGDSKGSDIDKMSALERLVSMLSDRTIKASTMPWNNRLAVCFTECPWGSLLRHAKQYSPYGIGFHKRVVYRKKGNPVIYANPDLFHSQEWSEKAYTFVTPFVPTYAPQEMKNARPFNGKPVDFSHEREWRVPEDFEFQNSDVCFVILKSVIDLKAVPDDLIHELGIEKFIFMDTYEKIEELWPTHVMD